MKLLSIRELHTPEHANHECVAAFHTASGELLCEGMPATTKTDAIHFLMEGELGRPLARPFLRPFYDVAHSVLALSGAYATLHRHRATLMEQLQASAAGGDPLPRKAAGNVYHVFEAAQSCCAIASRIVELLPDDVGSNKNLHPLYGYAQELAASVLFQVTLGTLCALGTDATAEVSIDAQGRRQITWTADISLKPTFDEEKGWPMTAAKAFWAERDARMEHYKKWEDRVVEMMKTPLTPSALH